MIAPLADALLLLFSLLCAPIAGYYVVEFAFSFLLDL